MYPKRRVGPLLRCCAWFVYLVMAQVDRDASLAVRDAELVRPCSGAARRPLISHKRRGVVEWQVDCKTLVKDAEARAARLADALVCAALLAWLVASRWSLVFCDVGRQAPRTRLATSFRGVQSRVIATPGVKSTVNGVAVSRDGSTLLVSDRDGGSHSVSEYSIADGVRRRVIGGPAAGSGPLQFNGPRQVWIADDGFVFVADRFNNRVQVLTPGLSNHAGFVGVGNLNAPIGVCANADIVVVSELDAHRLTVLKRSDGTVVRRMGSGGSGDGQLDTPHGVCFMSGDRHIAVADYKNDRVSVFGVDGAFVRHVGVGVLKAPTGVACSAFDELIVADHGNKCVRLFSSSGELLKTFGDGGFAGVAIHGSTVFVQDFNGEKCVLFT